MEIKKVESKKEVTECYPLLSQLRPQLKQSVLNERIAHLATGGYKLAYVDDGGVKAVVGYRIADWLHTGKYLEIEDLVTDSGQRSKGYGSLLFDWVIEQARTERCNQVRLVSGVRRERAHKFYLKRGMVWEAKYFSINVN